MYLHVYILKYLTYYYYISIHDIYIYMNICLFMFLYFKIA